MCAESIEPDATQCRHCGHALVERGRCPPEEAAALRRAIDRDLRLGVVGIALALGLLGLPQLALPLLVAGGPPGGLRAAMVVLQLAQLASLLVLCGGIGLCARARGRSFAWALLGLLGCLGPLVLLLLVKVCRRCGAQGGLTGSACAACDAPL